MNLGETICRLRTQAGLSQSDLADALEVSRQSVSKWETNASVPDLDKLIRMSEFFRVSLDELGENIHVSKYHLCRQFKRAFGVSPIQYHLDSRIDRAKLLLVTTDASIGDIAESVGFQSIYSFSRAFKKRENVSPSVYRR